MVFKGMKRVLKRSLSGPFEQLCVVSANTSSPGCAGAPPQQDGMRPVSQVYDSVGPSVQRFLPADLNPKVKEQIEAGMLNRPAAGAGPIRPAAAAAARPQPPKSAAPSKKAPATGAPAPQTAAPSQPSAPPSAASAYPSSPGAHQWGADGVCVGFIGHREGEACWL